jgi:hypothetical protein
MSHDRRTVLAAIGLMLPFGLGGRARAAAPVGPPPVLRFRPFEDALREAFASGDDDPCVVLPCRRVEVGHSDLLQAGVQGCHNDRPFAGFPSGHLRIIRVGCEPGRALGGVRLFVCAVDVVLTGGRDRGPSRPLDFAALPPAPVLAAPEPEPTTRELVGRRVGREAPTPATG